MSLTGTRHLQCCNARGYGPHAWCCAGNVPRSDSAHEQDADAEPDASPGAAACLHLFLHVYSSLLGVKVLHLCKPSPVLMPGDHTLRMRSQPCSLRGGGLADAPWHCSFLSLEAVLGLQSS